MELTPTIIREVIKRLIEGEDYRIEIVNTINSQFLNFTINFFKRIINAKIKNKDITVDWYKKELLSSDLTSQDIAIHSGLNKKTIHNMYNSSTKKIVIDASNQHYDVLFNEIKRLVDIENDLEINLTIKLRGVSVELNISESLIVINTLAVKRAELRGGAWSSIGKRVEVPLMQTLCSLYGVPSDNFMIPKNGQELDKEEVAREVDFYLIGDSNKYKCEIKLMGRGNPESADAVYARDSQVFVADKLSDMNKKQLDSSGIEWVELRAKGGFMRFEHVLKQLNIPYNPLSKDIESKLDKILDEILFPVI